MSDQSVSLRQAGNFRIIVGVVIALALIAGVVVWIRMNGQSDTSNTNGSANGNATPITTFDARQGIPQRDGDSDGLTDDEESQLGTNPTVTDSDRDDLSDFDEVKLYHSDPKKVDTDGDGNNDGTEVKNNFSPTGAGKLFDTSPSATQNVTQ